MGKITFHEFYNQIYPRKLWIAKRATEKDINNLFSYRDGEEITHNQEKGKESACTVFPQVMDKDNLKYGFLVVINNKMNVSMIAHEAAHIASEYYRDIGAIHDIDNQEPFCYLVGWCADCMNQVITNKFKD